MKKMFLLGLLTTTLFSDIKVLTSEKNGIGKIKKSDLIQLYLRKTDVINGVKLVPIDNKDSYKEFYKTVIKKSPKQLRAYWAKEIFKGSKKPPKRLSSAEIATKIKNGAKIISYASTKLPGKVVLTIGK
jgi:hypothetical protein